MRSHVWIRRGGWLSGAALVLLSTGVARADGPLPHPHSFIEYFVSELAPPGDEPVLLDGSPGNTPGPPEPVKISEYWIGLACAPADDALRAQLGLREGQGLVVREVVPDSPAAKAGVEQYDVLLKANDTPLEEVQALMDAVGDAGDKKEKKLTLELIRDGEKMTVQVKPAKRPDQAQWRLTPPGPENQAFDAIRKYLERVRPGEDGKPPLRFRFFNPGTILPHSTQVLTSNLPPDLSITITKSGDKPAKLKVTQGDQTWEINEDELDKLPQDVRPHVERMLGGFSPWLGWRAEALDFDFIPNPFGGPSAEAPADNPLKKQLEEMNRRMEDMRKSIDELRKQRSRSNSSEKKRDQI